MPSAVSPPSTIKNWILIGVLIFLSWAIYSELKRSDVVPTSSAVQTVMVLDCELSIRECRLQVSPLINLRFFLHPFGLPAMEPLTLSISGQSLADVQVQRAWFEGREMDMGLHMLIPKIETSDPDSLVLQGMIPVCSVNPLMVWQLKVLAEIRDQSYLFVFDLTPRN